MVYDSRIWQAVNGQWQPTNVANSMAGWRFATTADAGATAYATSQTSCNPGTQNDYQNFNWTDPSGTQRSFPIHTIQNHCGGGDTTSGDAFAADSSGYHMYVTNYTSETVFAKNGGQVFPLVEDTNGNYFSSSNGNLVDTLGRVPFTKSTNGSSIYYDVLNAQGTTSRFTVTTETINANTSFGQSGVTEFSGTLTAVQSIGFPDGSSYSFGYDSYGELDSITLRTGGQVTYTYTNFSDSYGNVNRWANTRVSAGGTWTYAPAVVTTCSPGTTGCQQTNTITKPSGDQAVYTFTLNNGGWNTELQTYTGSSGSGTLLRTIAISYDFSNACPLNGCFGAAYIRPTQVVTTDLIPGSSISKQTTLGYDSIYYGNVNAKKEWLYYSGSPPANPDRETDTIYLTTSSYLNKNIVDRPTDVITKNSGGTQVAETKFSYDSTSLTTLNGFSNHDDTNFGGSNTIRGNQTQIQRWVSGTTFLSESKGYSTDGQMLSDTDPDAHTTNYDYGDLFHNDDGSFNPPSYTPPQPTHAYLTKITYPNSQTKQKQYYYGSGKLAIDIDENGL